MSTTSPETSPDADLRPLGAVATAESISFAVLLVGSVLKRTTEFDPVPLLGALHGALFLALVALLALSWRRLGWSPLFWVATATILSPGAHWIVAAERRKRRAVRHGTFQPGTVQLGTVQPGTVQPGTVQPGTVQPGSPA